MIILTTKHLLYVNLIIILNDYRSTYYNLKRSYQHFGQFIYSYQGDQGQIETYGSEDDEYGYVEIKSTIKENHISLFRSITVYKQGEIYETEWSYWSEFERKRVIYKSGLWEEYGIDRYTGFGIRKVVYPDGQLFTNEVYGWGWNAIGEETYAIQNKSIPYLLEDNNEMNEYRYVSEDGLLNTIDLGSNYKKEILSSSSSSSDSKSSYSDSD